MNEREQITMTPKQRFEEMMRLSSTRGLTVEEFALRYNTLTPEEIHRMKHSANTPEPPPVPNERPHIADLVIADIRARKAEGVRKYGTPLQAGNGRDALMDAYQEALDLCKYLRQAIEERNHWVTDALEMHKRIFGGGE